MPVLPLIDLLILLGWTTLAAGGILKAIYLATSYRPTLLSLTPIDLFVVAMAFLGLALTLAARTWVRFNEPQLLAGRRAGLRQDYGQGYGSERRTAHAPAASDSREDHGPAPVAPPGGASAPQWQRIR